MRIAYLRLAMFAGLLPFCLPATAQPDPPADWNEQLKVRTHKTFWLTFEERTRWEERYGVGFGKAVNQQDMLSRLRIGAVVAPTEWLKVTVMGQDSRAPFYGVPAPNNLRDTVDLHELHVDLFGKPQGFGMSFGRAMLDYGETRVIGTPQWGNLARTYDYGRVFYRTGHMRFEALMVSPVKVLPDAFNKPELGERIWGMYNQFTDLWGGVSVDVYALRHSQNKIGGWSGASTLGTNSFGGRLYGGLPHAFKYSFEGIGQGGHLGTLDQRAYAWFAGLSRKVAVGKLPLNLSADYKVASGTKPGATNSGTYDQLAPANHDKFGHQDLFGWRNLKTFRSVETLNLTKTLALNLMYSDHRLMSATDALYNGSGSSIALSKKGIAGRHVGQELDTYLTKTWGHHLVGAGFGHFFKGEFVSNTTPNINPRYFYVFQQYSFK